MDLVKVRISMVLVKVSGCLGLTLVLLNPDTLPPPHPLTFENSVDPDQLASETGSALFTINPCPAEPGYILSLQTVQIQISWLLKKPTDLELHCLPLSM